MLPVAGESIEVLIAIFSLTGLGFISLLVPLLTGHLVAVSRLEHAEKEVDKWKTAYDLIKQAHDKQDRELERAQQSSEIVDQIMKALHSMQGGPKAES